MIRALICFVLHLLVVLSILSHFLVCFYWKFHFGRLNKIALPATCWKGKLGPKSLNNVCVDNVQIFKIKYLFLVNKHFNKKKS